MVSNPKTQEHLKRLRQDPRFNALQQDALKDPDNINVYVERARREFKLSGYWTELLPHILLSDIYPEVLAGGVVVETSSDELTGEPVYKIVVYPEATQDSILRAHSMIQERHKESGRTQRYRTSTKFELEAQAMHLSAQGFSSKEIADKLDIETFEVPDLIAKAKKKLQA